jgi:hypothetical protein
MHEFTLITETLKQMPVESLILLVPLGGMALAAFAIHAVWSIAKQKGRR